jgi:hypothetical protein
MQSELLFALAISQAILNFVGVAGANFEPKLKESTQKAFKPDLVYDDFNALASKPWSELGPFEKSQLTGYITSVLQKKNLKLSLELCAKIASYADLREIKHLPNTRLTATDKHMIRYPKEIKNLIENVCWNDYAQPDIITRIAQRLYDISQTFEHSGYTTFFHGHQWKLTLLQRIYKDLYQVYYKTRVPDDFTFTHLKQPNKYYDSVQEQTKRADIIASKNGWLNIDSALFLNKPLFGNINFRFSNSLYFFAKNYNEGVATGVPDIEQLFSFFNADELYKKYEAEFQNLKKIHAQASTYGNMLVIAIPHHLVSEYVFKTRHTDKDQREYCLVMTHDFALNPESGIKIISVNEPDQHKLQQFEIAYNELMNKILPHI